MERHVPTRLEKYWAESGRGDGQGDVEKKDHQSCRHDGKSQGKRRCSVLQIIIIKLPIINGQTFAGHYFIVVNFDDFFH